MVSEVASILAITGGASVALVRSKRHPASLRRLVPLLVAAGLFNLAVLGLSGFLREGNGFLATLHAGKMGENGDVGKWWENGDMGKW